MAKFNVGDRVMFVNNGGYDLDASQQSGTVVAIRGSGNLYTVNVDNYADDTLHFYESEIVPAKASVSSSEEIHARIDAIESELSALKALVQPEEKSVAKMTGNAARKAIVDGARKFVSDLAERSKGGSRNTDGNYTFNQQMTELTFHVNAEKGVVTALAKGVLKEGIRGKAFARCAPGDIFNADIGKAIAAGRLYGVPIPQYFFDAPKPVEVVAGMRVMMKGARKEYVSTIIKDGEKIGVHSNTVGFARKNPDYVTAILDDTEAQY